MDERPGERLVGVRVAYDAAPVPVRAWAEDLLGAPLVDVQPRVGGMSPAVAASLRAANGESAFVKTVGRSVNPDTPDHFRHEIEVLTALPPAPHRPRLLATYDDGDWVGIALEDIDGRHPDWASDADRSAVRDVVRRQMRELTPPPAGMPHVSTREVIAKHLHTIDTCTHEERAGLPPWAQEHLSLLRSLGQGSLDHHRDEAYCHWDIRHDNILIRHRDGQPLLVDWGMSRRAQRWADLMVFALEWVDSSDFETIMRDADLTAEEDRDVTGFLATYACRMLIMSQRPAPPGLPHMPAFSAQVGARTLRGVRRRLSDGSGSSG